ncbi:polyprenyl synthetase family protein [Porphyromonas sp.]|uniref:polyprenyl synthetase family protein n=1 Tax=Porphyromonas sp. TaxID=1924944 RepID=UPI0026DAE1BE|nr:polyprenyl synthetase family protein [Porphyromonas sp.]MDO4771449.1 polyprenyl synthetase family protein [Porphyromonas sp.]
MSFFASLPDSVHHSMESFEKEYYSSLSSSSEDMSRAVEILSSSAGKRMRPLLLILTAGCFGEIDKSVINGAVFVELLHVATLIHDDVIDESGMRRGNPALHTLIGSHKAVLMGDYVLATAMMKAAQTQNHDVVKALALLGRMLIEGEFLQMSAARKGFPTEEQYLDIINKKTASLMAMSVYIGASLIGVKDPQTLRMLSDATTKLGLAFQIKDDIFDYMSANDTGKPTGNDLREHKVTLPLIYPLTKLTKKDGYPRQKEMIEILDKEVLSQEEIQSLIDFAHREGGVAYAESRLKSLIEESKTLFDDALPECEYKKALLTLCDYVGSREK